MFRFLPRARRSIRVPIEDAAGGQQVRRVKISRLVRSRSSRLFSSFVTFYLCYRIGDALVNGRATISVDTDGQSADGRIPITKGALAENAEKQQVMMNQLAMIGGHAKLRSKHSISDVVSYHYVPVWFRQKPGRTYAPTEPEGKDFLRIQQDEKKKDELARTLTTWTAAWARTHKSELLKMLPGSGKAFAEIRFIPKSSPSSWEVPMIYFLKDGTASFGWVTLPPQNGARLEFIIRPTVTLNAAWASLKAFGHVIYVAASTRWEGGNVDDILQRHALKARGYRLVEQQAQESQDKSDQPQWPSLDQFWKPPDPDRSAKTVHYGFLKSIPFSAAIAFAGATFNARQAAGLENYKKATSKGLLQVVGLVKFPSSIGDWLVYVTADYSPSEDCFIGRPTVTSTTMRYDYPSWQRFLDEAKKTQDEKRRMKRQEQSRLISAMTNLQQPKQSDNRENETVNEEVKVDKEKD